MQNVVNAHEQDDGTERDVLHVIGRAHQHEAIAERIQALSAEMGTQVHRDGDRLWIDCASA